MRSARKLTPVDACETSNAAAAAFVTAVSDRLACSAGWGGRAGSTQWPVDRGRKSVVIKAQGRSAKGACGLGAIGVWWSERVPSSSASRELRPKCPCWQEAFTVLSQSPSSRLVIVSTRKHSITPDQVINWARSPRSRSSIHPRQQYCLQALAQCWRVLATAALHTPIIGATGALCSALRRHTSSYRAGWVRHKIYRGTGLHVPGLR